MKVNPLYKQESRISARSFKLPLIILIFNGVLALVALLEMYSVITQVRLTAEIQYSSFLSLYLFVATIEFALLLFIIPAITAGSISGERERRTLDLMLTTQMTAADIVFGKLFSCLSTVLLLIVSSFPVLALVFIYGGVSVMDVFLLLLCYLVTAFLIGCLSIFCSAMFKRSTVATVVSYCLMGVLVVGTVALNGLAYSLLRVTGASDVQGTGGFLYLLLFNPASVFRRVMSSQLGGAISLRVFAWLDHIPENLITEHWLLFGMAAQALLAALFLWGAIKAIAPRK